MARLKDRWKGRRVSKNVEDLRPTKAEIAAEKKRVLGVRAADNTIRGSKGIGRAITVHNNIVNSEDPMSSRIPTLMKDKPKTKPKNMQTFKKK